MIFPLMKRNHHSGASLLDLISPEAVGDILYLDSIKKATSVLSKYTSECVHPGIYKAVRAVCRYWGRRGEITHTSGIYYAEMMSDFAVNFLCLRYEARPSARSSKLINLVFVGTGKVGGMSFAGASEARR